MTTNKGKGIQQVAVIGVLAAAVLLPAGRAQQLPEVVPDCPSQALPSRQPAARPAVTYEHPAAAKPFSSSHVHPGLLPAPGPLTLSNRFDLFLHRTGSKVNLGKIALQTQYSFQDRPYGPGVPGYTKLYAAKLADSTSRNFLHVVALSHTFGQDPRYYRSTATTTWGRFADGATSGIVTRTNEGKRTFNSSRVLATFLSSALSNAYYPAEERGWGPTMSRTGRRLLLDVSGGVVREFAPDLVRKLFRKKPADHTDEAPGN